MIDIIDEKEMYLTILDNVSDGIYCVDENRNIFFWNKEAERISGYTAEEMLSKSCAESRLEHKNVSGKYLCDVFCPLLGTMFDGQPREETLYLKRKDGRRITVRVRTRPLCNGGQSIGAIEYFHEVDEMEQK